MTDTDRKQEKKRDSVLRKMLNTPPDPHKVKKNKEKQRRHMKE